MSTFHIAYSLLLALLIMGYGLFIFKELKEYKAYKKRLNERKQKMQDLMSEGKHKEALLYGLEEYEKQKNNNQ